jgi:hypothetical protein
MSKLDLTEQHAHERAGFAAPVPISIFRDDTRDHANHRMLYVLGFGIAGAIVTNALVFIYFAVVYASGVSVMRTRTRQRSRFCSRCLHRDESRFHPSAGRRCTGAINSFGAAPQRLTPRRDVQ